jgi:hypothetical protein
MAMLRPGASKADCQPSLAAGRVLVQHHQQVGSAVRSPVPSGPAAEQDHLERIEMGDDGVEQGRRHRACVDLGGSDIRLARPGNASGVASTLAPGSFRPGRPKRFVENSRSRENSLSTNNDAMPGTMEHEFMPLRTSLLVPSPDAEDDSRRRNAGRAWRRPLTMCMGGWHG